MNETQSHADYLENNLEQPQSRSSFSWVFGIILLLLTATGSYVLGYTHIVQFVFLDALSVRTPETPAATPSPVSDVRMKNPEIESPGPMVKVTDAVPVTFSMPDNWYKESVVVSEGLYRVYISPKPIILGTDSFDETIGLTVDLTYQNSKLGVQDTSKFDPATKVVHEETIQGENGPVYYKIGSVPQMGGPEMPDKRLKAYYLGVESNTSPTQPVISITTTDNDWKILEVAKQIATSIVQKQ